MVAPCRKPGAKLRDSLPQHLETQRAHRGNGRRHKEARRPIALPGCKWALKLDNCECKVFNERFVFAIQALVAPTPSALEQQQCVEREGKAHQTKISVKPCLFRSTTTARRRARPTAMGSDQDSYIPAARIRTLMTRRSLLERVGWMIAAAATPSRMAIAAQDPTPGSAGQS